MATIKSYTDIEQSRKLAKILPLESADCFWDYDDLQKYYRINWFEDGYNKDSQLRLNKNNVCAWSLAALYGILPNNEEETTTLSRGGWNIEPIKYLDNWWCEYEDESHIKDFTVSADNPVDACVSMIEYLHKLNLL